MVFISVITVGMMGHSEERSSGLIEESDVILSERFDEAPPQEGISRAPESHLQLHGATLVPAEKRGKSLRLNTGSDATVNLSKGLNAKGGTISFWVKPLWGKEEKGSHTFLTMPWADGRKSYMAISFGWWEPKGSQRFYFIVSNQEAIHCSVPYRFDADAWIMITAVWKSGDDGYCRLFVNGEKIAASNKSFMGTYASAGPIYLGSDKGATDQKGRSANTLLDDFIVLNYPLSDEEVSLAYKAQEKEPVTASIRRWKWLDEGIALPLRQKRNNQGQLLESRAIFDEDMHWAFSKKKADEILTRVKAAGFNIYVPCVWHGNGAYYPTALAPMNPKLASMVPEGYDPLAYLIEKAHSMGIEIHPWFTVALRQSAQFPRFYGEGVPENAYDVHNPEFRKFITDLMLDVVRRYDVDGVNLDYIRAMGICTSPSCRENYNQKTGSNLLFDYPLKLVMGSARERIQRWQDDAVTDIVTNFSKNAKKLRPNLVISIDGVPKPSDELRNVEGRNELKWANNGLIDVIYGMDYNEKIDFETIDQVRSGLRQPEKVVVLFGNYEKRNKKAKTIPRPGELVAKYATFAQHKWPDSGVAFYLYSMLSDEQIINLRKGPFAEEAIPRWKG
jgi:uncharacterized lipoprotein YddW (UPF0748 family)